MKLYGISGLGADKRVFDYLALDCDFIPIEWIEPKPNESIEDYSLRLSAVIDNDIEFGILGVSFGGLIATEISKILKPVLTILISSVETKYELRPLIKAIGKLNLTKVIPLKLFDPPRKIAHFLFGTNKTQLLDSILDDSDIRFTKWAICELVSWKNQEKLESVLKIGGTKDKLIPSRWIENTNLINGGGHFMIVDKATEISKLINEKINERHHNNVYNS